MRDQKVLVIGGGLGGLSAAISMAAEGFDVRLFEKNHHLGGKLNEGTIDGFTFDLGPSIVTMPHLFARLFTMHQKKMEDYIKMERLHLEWKCFFEDGVTLDLYADPEKFVRENEGLGEEDLRGLREYLEYTEKLGELVEEGYFAQGMDTSREVLRYYGVASALKGFDYFSTMAQGVERYLKNSYLQHIFNFFIKYVGSSPYVAPAVLNLLPYIQFKYGLWYVPGGLYHIARGLKRLMEEVGIGIHTDSEIVKIERRGEEATGIILSNGERVEGDIVISNMEVIPAYKKLLEGVEVPASYEKKFEPACSGYVLHLGLNREYPQLDHHNFFFSKDPRRHFASVFQEYQLPEDPTIYLVAVSRTDPLQTREGCENIKILPHIPHLGQRDFSDEEYRGLRERVLDKLERMGLTDLRSHIVVEDEWYPKDIRDMYYSNQGAIYGVVSDRKKNRGFKTPKKSPHLSNLYFVGGSVNPGGGMPMVILSGQQVASLIVKEQSS